MMRFLTCGLSVLLLTSCAASSSGIVRSETTWKNLEANALFERAEAYYEQKNYTQAIMTYREYRDEYADFHRANDASFRLAQCLEALGERHEAALQYRKTALEYARVDLAPTAHLRAGELFELEGAIRDAKYDYEKTLKYEFTEPARIAALRLQDLVRRHEFLLPGIRGMNRSGAWGLLPPGETVPQTPPSGASYVLPSMEPIVQGS